MPGDIAKPQRHRALSPNNLNENQMVVTLRDEHENLRRAGIQAGLKFQEIAYNRRSNTVIAYFRSGQTGRLYYRKSSSVRYREVADLGGRVTAGRAVVAAEAPVLFANLLAYHDDSEGADWWGVARLNTQTGRLSAAFRQEDLKLRRPYSQGWVRELLDSWPDGRGVVCVMSFSRPPTAAEKRRWKSRGGGGELMSVGEHWICDLDLERKRYKRLTQLKAMFY